MDANQIRVAYIKGHLQRALAHESGARAARIFREFRRYVEWHSNSLPELDRKRIDEQLQALSAKNLRASGA